MKKSRVTRRKHRKPRLSKRRESPKEMY